MNISPKHIFGENFSPIDAYFLSREAVMAYLTRAKKEDKRNIYHQIFDSIEGFLKLDLSPEEVEQIESIIESSEIFKKVEINSGQLLDKLRALNSEGLKLLDIPDSLDIPQLKLLYRKASKKYHPDLGGSDEEMKKVNEAYTVFHEFLTTYMPVENDGKRVLVNSNPSDFESWQFVCHLTLAVIHGDVFAIDKSLLHLEKAVELIDYVSAKFASKLIKVVDVNCDLTCIAKGAGRLGLRSEFDSAVTSTSKLMDIMHTYWVKIHEDDEKPGRERLPNSENLEQEFGVKLVINHPLKADNAYRLRVIDQERYQKTLSKYRARNFSTEQTNKKLFGFYSEAQVQLDSNQVNEVGGFENLQIDQPVGFSEDRFVHLTDGLKKEYIETYANPTISSNFVKFANIRCHEILRALIHNYSNESLDQSIKEVNFYLEETELLRDQFESLMKIFEYFKSLDEKERAEKTLILKILDTDSKREWNPFIMMMEDHADKEQSHTFRIEPTPYYLKFIRNSVDNLHRYRLTGQFKR